MMLLPRIFVKKQRIMAYSNFTLREVKRQFGLVEQREPLFTNVAAMEPGKWLLETLELTHDAALISEKERSEMLVVPVLIELRRQHNKSISMYSGAFLDVDSSRGLNGECDFIMARGPQTYTLEAPIFCVVEAKKNDVEGALGQCVAQLIGARLYNQQDGQPADELFGCVTTGLEWKFLHLTGSVIRIDLDFYFINEIAQLLGVLNAITTAR